MVWNAIKALFSGAEEAGAVFKEEWVELLERDVSDMSYFFIKKEPLTQGIN